MADFWRVHPGIELTLREAVPARLGEMLREGELDVAVMAQPGPFDERFDVRPLYRERVVVGFPLAHRFAEQNGVRLADVDGETKLVRVNREYLDYLLALCYERGIHLRHGYRSEREDWIQTMVMAGMGIGLLPEFSIALPGRPTRPVIEPEMAPEVALVTVAGRRFSPAVARFVRAARAYPWPSSEPGSELVPWSAVD